MDKNRLKIIFDFYKLTLVFSIYHKRFSEYIIVKINEMFRHFKEVL